MFNSRLSTAPIRFLTTLILGAVLLTGCARSTPETKTPEAPQVGVIDMDKAISAHPKYQEWQKLKQQAATISQQLAGESGKAAKATQPPSMDLAGTATAGLKAAVEQEFNVKITAKQQELQVKLAEKANKVHAELAVELKAYAEELDKEYQPQIFNQQLKLQTIRMDEKAAAEVREYLDALKTEQHNKLAAREKEVAQNMDAALAPDKAAIEQELAVYAKQLNAELNKKMAAQAADVSSQIVQSSPSAMTNAGNSQLEQQLGMKQQEINVLEEYIVSDIRDKTAKVASERRLDAVLTGYKINVSAVDITDAVMAAIKK